MPSQEIQLKSKGIAPFYPKRKRRFDFVGDLSDVEPTLEKSRIYGPFPVDVLNWVMAITARFQLDPTKANGFKMFTLGHDTDGREYLEY